VSTKPKSSLWDLVKSGKSSTRVLGKVEQHLQLKPEDDRRTDILHVSEMSKPDWCLRAGYYALAGYEAASEEVHFRARGVFDEGDRIHEKWQTRLWEMGILHGKWRCILCDHRWWETSPRACPGCGWIGTDHLRYLEVPMVNWDYRVGGHADGGLDDGYSRSGMVEVKSVGVGTVRMEAPHLLKAHTYKADGKSVVDVEGLWRAIRSPFPSHIRQGLLYCWVGDYDEAVFLYESKMSQAHKEFRVKRDDRKIAHLLDQAKKIDDALEVGAPPEPPDWADPTHRSCKACKFYRVCWDERDEAQDGQEAAMGNGPQDQESEAEGRGDEGPGSARLGTGSTTGEVPVTAGTSRRLVYFVRP